MCHADREDDGKQREDAGEGSEKQAMVALFGETDDSFADGQTPTEERDQTEGPPGTQDVSLADTEIQHQVPPSYPHIPQYLIILYQSQATCGSTEGHPEDKLYMADTEIQHQVRLVCRSA